MFHPSPAKSAAGRIGGLTVHARHDSNEIAARARAGLMRRFELEVDPEGVLPEAERRRRAGYAHRAHMARLAMKSAQARRKGSRRAAAIIPRVSADAPQHEVAAGTRP